MAINALENPENELRLRKLAEEWAKGVSTPRSTLDALGFSEEEWKLLAKSRAFRRMLEEASAEWRAADNTHKRVRLKSAATIEEAIPTFSEAMSDQRHPLSARVRVLEALAKIGGLGQQEAVSGGAGQMFKLEIHLGDGKKPLIIDGRPVHKEEIEQSKLAAILPYESLTAGIDAGEDDAD